MCQGNMLEPVREEFPDRFFDVGICESHAVAFAAGHGQGRPAADRRHLQHLPAAELRPDLPGGGAAEPAGHVLLDRAGLTGPDGPTHHGMFDIAYLRPLPNLVVMAPGDAPDVAPMLDLALASRRPDGDPLSQGRRRDARPRRRPRSNWARRKSSIGGATACSSPAARWPRPACRPPPGCASEGLDVGVINARFVKPLDTDTILRAVEQCPMVVTVEEGALMGGFGSAVLEAASDAGLDASRIRRLGIPDRFIEHGERGRTAGRAGPGRARHPGGLPPLRRSRGHHCRQLPPRRSGPANKRRLETSRVGRAQRSPTTRTHREVRPRRALS